jgi:hypothetical protein
MQTLQSGVRTPFLATDCTHYFTLGTGNFSPIDDTPDVLTATQEDVFIKNGFLVSNATDTAGYAWCVTWEEYQMHRLRSNKALVTNAQILALCTPIRIYLTSGGFTMTPVVKVYSTGDKNYTSEPAYINVWTIR